MPDVESPAESSPAAETPSAPAPAEKPAPDHGTFEITVPQNSEDYAQWRMTGKLPDKKDKASKDESPTSKSADEESGKGAPVSETGQPPRQKRNADSRKEELNREIRDLLAKRDSLKQEVEGKKDVKPAEPSSAPQEPQRPVKPKPEAFKTWEEYETAQDKYVEELADWRAGERIREYTARQQQEASTREMQKRLDEAEEKYGEGAKDKIVNTARAVFDDQKIPPFIKVALGRSDVLVDALYAMGDDSPAMANFMRLAKEDPLEALERWFDIQKWTREAIRKDAKSAPEEGEERPRGANGQFLESKPPPSLPRKVSQAPPPATELGARSAPPVDEVSRAGTAAAKGDPKAVRAYIEAKNREALAKRRTG